MLKLIIAGGLTLGLSGAVSAQTWGSPTAPAKPVAAAPAKTTGTTTVKDIDALQKAVTDAWEKMPLTQRRAIFISRPADVYGDYAERASNVFKPGEKLVAYIEPIGYTWKANGDVYDFGVSVDFVVKSPEGKILAGQEGFGKFFKTSHAKLQEFMLTLTLSVDGAPPGKYVLEYKIKDNGSDKSSTVALPFTIAE